MVMLVSVVVSWSTIGSPSAGGAISASRTAIEAAYFIRPLSLQIGWRDHPGPGRRQVGGAERAAVGRGLRRARVRELRRIGRQVGELGLHLVAHRIQHGAAEPAVDQRGIAAADVDARAMERAVD